MKNTLNLLFCVLLISSCTCKTTVNNSSDSQVKKIWGNENHCAFTSLIKFKDTYYCSFREGESHVFDKNGNAEGKVRILASTNGDNWESVSLMHKPGIDLRDPKLSVTPDGRLMVIIGGSIYRNQQLEGMIPHVSFSNDGITYTDPIPVTIKGINDNKKDWIWRVTWDGDTGYAVNYFLGENGSEIALLKTTDGITYESVTRLDVDGSPNESTIRILPDKQMQIMVRREQNDRRGYWGISQPPYTEWEWTPMEMPLGGPDFVTLSDGTIIAGTRSYYIPSYHKTILMKGNDKGRFQEMAVLPSGGDTSYPGLIVEGDELWVSYYSSHETEKAAIYLAKLPLSVFK